MQVDGLLASGPPFWDQPVPELDSFLNGVLTGDTVSLDACLVPPPLAASFGLSTDSSLSSFPRAAVALGTAGSGGAAGGQGGGVSARGFGGGSGGLQPPRRSQQQPAQQPTTAGAQQLTQAVPQAATMATTVGRESVPLVPQVPPVRQEPPLPLLAMPSMQQQQQQPQQQRAGPQAAQQQQQQAAARPARGTRREAHGARHDLSGQHPQVESGLPAALQQGSGMPPTSFSGLLAEQQAAATAALVAAAGGAVAAAAARAGASDRPYSSQDPQQQDAVPHLRYDFAQAQQDQAAVVAQFAQQQQQQHQAAAMFAQQQAYQQQQQAAAAAYQQQQAAAAAAFQQQAQQTQTQGGSGAAGGSAGASAGAFFQRQQQAAAAAAFAPFPNPYGGGGGWPMYPQFGGQYGQYGGQYGGGYFPYGMQYPGMQFPGMQQGGGAGLLPLPTPGGSNIGGGSIVPSPPQPQQLQPQEVVQQSDGGAHIDDDPCAIKKARLIWTPALHRRFLESVEKVGGVDRALPKAVMKEMAVAGLTRENVASHLQKHRMRLKREEEEEGGGDAPSGHQPAPGSARAVPRARHDATANNPAGDAEMPDAPHEAAAEEAGREDPSGAAAAERRNRRARHATTMPAPSELSDGRTAEDGAA